MGKQTRDPELTAIGNRVRLARQGRNLTLEQAAEAAETSVQFLSQVERGEQSMTMIKLGRLARALGVSSDYLIFGRPPLEEHAALAVEYMSALSPIERDLLSRQVILFRGLLDELLSEHG